MVFLGVKNEIVLNKESLLNKSGRLFTYDYKVLKANSNKL
ncbi:MAG: hypothetical protein ACJAUR_002452 [Ulvibacter sp.]|jgi:hypothetical protein|tara:strand:- start:193 stop:312 length:120 start_codon:yes stop_codon:yes gene_type:complete